VDHTADAKGTVPPGYGPEPEVPERAVDHVVAVAQGDDVQRAHTSHLVIGVGADEAVGGIDDAGYPSRAIAPGRGLALAVPVGALDHVVAVAQGGDVAAHLVIGVAAHEAVAGVHDTGHRGRAAAPGRRPALAVPERAAHHVVAVAQEEDVVGAD